MLRFVRLSAVILSILFVAGCYDSPEQSKLCQVNDLSFEATKECKNGQKVVFLPNTFGNEQMPVIFAAINCDHRYAIALTNGGVSCIYNRVSTIENANE